MRPTVHLPASRQRSSHWLGYSSRRILRALLALLLILGLGAFAVSRGDVLNLLGVLGSWINSLVLIFGIAIVAHTASSKR